MNHMGEHIYDTQILWLEHIKVWGLWRRFPRLFPNLPLKVCCMLFANMEARKQQLGRGSWSKIIDFETHLEHLEKPNDHEKRASPMGNEIHRPRLQHRS